MNEIEKLNMIAEWQEQHKQLIADLDNSKKPYWELEKENAELKADNDARKFAMAMSEKVEKQLREENAELKHTIRRWKNDRLRKASRRVRYQSGRKECYA